jgi:hypothetical protein
MKEQPPQIFIAQNSQLQTKTVGSKSSDISLPTPRKADSLPFPEGQNRFEMLKHKIVLTYGPAGLIHK